MSLPTVEVSLAFSFKCASCGHENFARSVIHEFSPEEQGEVAEDFGEKPQTGDWLTHPEQVQCDKCGAEFRAIDPGELADET